MNIRRTIPPAAAPIPLRDLLYGFYGMVNGNVREKMEKKFRDYFGTEHVFFVSSGKAALYLILLALKSIRDRSKVIIPAYTCYSVPSAVQKAGLKIDLCDIEAETLDFDYEALESVLDDDTLCIIPTHLFGIPSDVDTVNSLCKDRGIYIIEDVAQAMGVTVNGKRLGTSGDVAFFSLGRGKNITCGSGGIIVTYSEEIADALQKTYKGVKAVTLREYIADIVSVVLMSIFITPYLYWFPQGLPFLKIGETRFYKDFPVFRLNGFKTGLMRRWQEFLESYNGGRTETGKYYLKELNLEKVLPIYSFSFPYLRFPIYVTGNPLRDEGLEGCRRHGITRMYPDSINNIDEIKSLFKGMSYRKSETIAQTLFTLPTHSLLKKQDKSNICNIVRNAINLSSDYGSRT